jgi:hypothetical protein
VGLDRARVEALAAHAFDLVTTLHREFERPAAGRKSA